MNSKYNAQVPRPNFLASEGNDICGVRATCSSVCVLKWPGYKVMTTRNLRDAKSVVLSEPGI
ncbi:hypothetical protein PIB30_069405 [Stylosanthes scabra]|uniref:Uncharacterized protein n=1 Tax=Stylosanthes scabra TaxID=79078 RepID=A0ABU6UMK4_9FABA|nr:hypothetical protein [Stylosanthes scabra]